MESPAALKEDRRDRQRLWAWVTLVAGVGLIIGSLLPWVTISAPLLGTVDITATDGDGMLTLIAGLAISLIGILGLTRGVGVVGVVFLAFLVLFAAWVAFADLGSITELAAEISDDDFGAASVGIGLWLVSFASVIGGVGWFGLIFTR